MSGIATPEPLRLDLTVRRDLPSDDVVGFLGDLWRDPEGPDVGLMFADWLEDHGDARSQPVRWSLVRENVYSESARATYQERMTEWWLRHGRAWVGPVARNVPLFWHRGCLTARIEVGYHAGESPMQTTQRVRSLRQAPWVGRIELGHAHMGGILYDLGPHLRAVSLRACSVQDLSGLERVPQLRQLTFQEYIPPRLELRNLPELEVLEVLAPDQLNLLLLYDLAKLHRLELHDCQAVEEMRVERGPNLSALWLMELVSLRWLTLTDLPRLERLEVSRLGLAELRLTDCAALPADEIAAIHRQRRG